MSNSIKLRDGYRRNVLKKSRLNGIDFVEVFLFNEDSQINTESCLIFLHCFNSIGLKNIKKENIVIKGGTVIKNIKSKWVRQLFEIKNDKKMKNNDKSEFSFTDFETNAILNTDDSISDRVLVIKTDKIGDYSEYTISLQQSHGYDLPLPEFDEIFSQIALYFKSNFQTRNYNSDEGDCLCSEANVSEIRPVSIDYMAKDFASFRRNILDHLSEVIPNYKERNPADLGIVITELISYVGDILSYYQDAVSTESYLGTCRDRISASRHVKLVDYYMHNGCNSRVWITIEVKNNVPSVFIPKKTVFLTSDTHSYTENVVCDLSALKNKVQKGSQVFESMHNILAYSALNNIFIYTWGDTSFCLRKGTTSATIRNDNGSLDLFLFKWQDALNPDVQLSKLVELFEFLVDRYKLDWVLNCYKIGILNIDILNENTIKLSSNIIEDNDDFTRNIYYRNSLYLKLDIVNPSVIVSHDYRGKNRVCTLFAKQISQDNISIYSEILKAGDVIIFEQVYLPNSVLQHDNNINHRQAVRLTNISRSFDKLFGLDLLEISWHKDDALNFNLFVEVDEHQILYKKDNGDDTPKTMLLDSGFLKRENKFVIGIARGNIVLADHGYTAKEHVDQSIISKDKYISEFKPIDGIFDGYDDLIDFTQTEFLGKISYAKFSENPISFRPSILNKPLTFGCSLYDYLSSAKKTCVCDIHKALPIIKLISYYKGHIKIWMPKSDLLGITSFNNGYYDINNFVVEVDNNLTSFIRFPNSSNYSVSYDSDCLSTVEGSGNIHSNEYFKDMGDDSKFNDKNFSRNLIFEDDNDDILFFAIYRTGNGKIGNVAAESIKCISSNNDFQLFRSSIARVRNPLPAKGGEDQENLKTVRQFAPYSFKTQQRAVTANDYAEILNSHPEIQKAIATFKWTGSWNTVLIYIDRKNGKNVDEQFKQEINNLLNSYRLTGYDLEIRGPKFVAIYIKINIVKQNNYLLTDVLKLLYCAFNSNSNLCKKDDNGLFDPDNFSFGQPVLLSKVYEKAMNVKGVKSCYVERFERLDCPSEENLKRGYISILPDEIARIDNNPNLPNNGKIMFNFVDNEIVTKNNN